MNIKPGYKTTEFWVTILVTLVGILQLTGVIGNEEGQQWIDVLTPLILAIVPAVYAYGRSQVKRGG